MSNIDRAAGIIRAMIKIENQTHDIDVTQALADAGLLAPEPPESKAFPNGEIEWYTLDGFVNLDTDGTITMAYDERDEDDALAGVKIEPGELVFTRISEARALALALLAATTPEFHPRSS